MDDTRSTNRGRRILARIAVVLCLLFAVGVLPMAAFAAPKTVSDVEATYLNTATINLMATGSIDKTYNQLDGGAVAEGASATTSIYGAHVLKFWSTDTSGAEPPVIAPSFVDDSVLPVVGSDCKASYTTTAKIKLTAIDNFNGSGVDFLCYRVDGGKIVTAMAPASLDAAKLLFARIAAIKVSGIRSASAVDPNQTPPHPDRGPCASCHDVIIPTPQPTTTPEPTSTSAPAGGVSGKVVVTGAGTHTIEYWAQDIARNTTTHVVKTFAKAKVSTRTSLKASRKSIRSGGYVTLTAKLRASAGGRFSNTYIRFQVRAKGSTHYVLLKNVKVRSTGSATYRYKVGKKGTRYHRVKFLGNATYRRAPIKYGKALRVR